MLTLQNNTFMFVFDSKIGTMGSEPSRIHSLDVWEKTGLQGGLEWIGQTSFTPQEAEALVAELSNLD